MRLIGVAAEIGKLGEAGDLATAQQAQRAIETQHAGEKLRPNAKFTSETLRQMLAAAADLRGEISDGEAAMGRLQTLNPIREIARQVAARRRQAARYCSFEQREPTFFGVAFLQALNEFLRRRAEQILRIDQSIADLTKRKAE